MKEYTSEEYEKMFNAFLKEKGITEEYKFKDQEDLDNIINELEKFEKEWCAERELALTFDDMLFMAFQENT